VLVDEALRRLTERLDPLRQRRAVAEAQVERPARGAQRLVDAGQHPSQTARAVGRQQPQAARIVTRAELTQRLLERLAAEHSGLTVIEHAEARVESCREWIGLQ